MGHQIASSCLQSALHILWSEQSHLLCSPNLSGKLKINSFFFTKANNSYLPVVALPRALLLLSLAQVSAHTLTGFAKHPARLHTNSTAAHVRV